MTDLTAAQQKRGKSENLHFLLAHQLNTSAVSIQFLTTICYVLALVSRPVVQS